MREYTERLGQFLLRKIFRRATYFYGLGHSNLKVVRLVNEPSRCHFVSFGGVDEIKPKQVFLLAGTHVKAVAVIGWICNETAILQNNPIFRPVASGDMDNRGAKNSNDN